MLRQCGPWSAPRDGKHMAVASIYVKGHDKGKDWQEPRRARVA